MTNRLLNILSVTGSFLVIFGTLFLIQDWLFGKITVIHDTIVLQTFRLKDVLFTVTSILIIWKYFKISAPQRWHDNHEPKTP